MTDYDLWLDRDLDAYYEDTEDFEPEPEWDGPYPEDDYDYEGY
jgi:hypothetical protein